jgi:hypothetical protein
MSNLKSMRLPSTLFMLTLCLLCLPSSYLQAADHTIQAGVGVEYAQSTRLPESKNLGGLVLAGSYAQNRWLRWTLSFDLLFGSTLERLLPPEVTDLPPTANFDQMMYQFHFGPEFSRHYGKATLFAHVMPGYSHWSLGHMVEGYSQYYGENGFSLALGGGVDFHVKKHFDLRFQADYVPSWYGTGKRPEWTIDPPLSGNQSPYNNLRIGMVFLYTIHRQ